MAGPLSGIGAGVQAINNPFTPGAGSSQTIEDVQNDQTTNQAPVAGSIQESSAAPAESADSETQNTDVTAQEQQNALAANQNDDEEAGGRGSIIDITV